MTFTQLENEIIYKENEMVLARVCFPACGDGVVDINHTFVDESLRGQGAASRMLECTAAYLRETNRKAVLSCSYAQKWFEKHPEYSDLLAQ